MQKTLLITGLISTLIGGLSLQAKAQQTIVLYDQDFENSRFRYRFQTQIR